MTAPNMAAITESLERSLQNFSLNHERRSNSGGGGRDGGEDGVTRRSSTSAVNNNSSSSSNLPITVSDTTLELNSHLSLPYHWEQCLDLKTGEIYYINWRNGMKASEDPRTAAQYSGGDFYSEEEDDEDEDDEDEDEDSSYDSEESPSETSPCSTREKGHCNSSSSSSNSNNINRRAEKDKDTVLVVAGCKSCLMYFMVPKQVEDCPKCNGQLLHFDRSESSSP